MSVVVNQSLSVISTNPTNNTAVVKYIVTCTCSGESYNNYSQTGTFKVDGVLYSSSYTLPKNTTTTVFSMNITVSNANARVVQASYSFPTTPSGGTKTGNISINIPSMVTPPKITSFSVKSKTSNSLTFSFTCTKADTFYYRLGEGSWVRGSSGNITSGTFTINGLSPNTSYTIHLIARNWINESADTYVQDIKSISEKTYDAGKISSVNNFIHGDNAVVTVSNQSGSAMNLTMKIGNTQILSKSVKSGINTIVFTDAQLDSIYKLYGSNNFVTANFILTAGNSTDSKTCTITLKRKSKDCIYRY